MIELERDKNNKWIFQKNISSSDLIKSYVEVLNEIKDIDKTQIQDKLREKNAYTGRSIYGSLSTMGVRFSQMCFYMFGYKSDRGIFIPTQTTFNMLHDTNAKNKNMLANLFSIQYPHPYSKTPDNFKIYAGRLILKLLTEERIGKKLYIDEFAWFLPFLKTLNHEIYEDLIESILEYRQLSFTEKNQLFNDSNDDGLFANCFHEIKYYFITIFQGFGVFQLIEDRSHNNNQTFSFKHGNTPTFRTDSVVPRKKIPGYIRLNPNLVDATNALLASYSPFDIPTSLDNSHVFSKKEWIEDLYETEMINYLAVIFPSYDRQRDIINSLADMTHKSKYGSRDGKDFENSLKPVFELFREVLNVDIISGSGDTDILCTVEDPNLGTDHYKVNVDAKTGTSAGNLNPARLGRHIQKNSSRYCIVVAPRFSRGTVLDLEGYPIVIVKAESLATYLSKECLSNSDSMADYIEINDIISNNLGSDVTSKFEELTDSKYGIQI
ncbi:MAG: hypothetical protein WC219_06960 [Acholeplasmataceae bacterium]